MEIIKRIIFRTPHSWWPAADRSAHRLEILCRFKPGRLSRALPRFFPSGRWSRSRKLVLTDMMMPVMDGVATVRVLRKLNPDLPIIAASGLSANGHTAKVAGLGVKHFLPKPYTAETLLRTLKEALAGVVAEG
ncbi:MAG: response regulator [Verrucomicrobiales bacterium]|nr:response regulator [Verrucomicrobiales bacterium]